MGDGRSLSSASGSSSSSTLFNDPSGMSISSLQSSPYKSATYHSLTSNTSTLKPMPEHPERERDYSHQQADYSGEVRNAVQSNLFRSGSPMEEQPTSVSESLTEDLVPVRQHASALQDMLESDHTITPSVSPTLHSTAVAEPGELAASSSRMRCAGVTSPQRASPYAITSQQPSVQSSHHVSPFLSQITSPYASSHTSLRSSPQTEVAVRVSPVLSGSPSVSQINNHNSQPLSSYSDRLKETSRPDTSSRLLASQTDYTHQLSRMSDTGISLGAVDSTLSRSATTQAGVSHRPPASPRSLSPCSRKTAGSPPVRSQSSCGYRSTQKSTFSQTTKSDVSTNTAPLSERYLPVAQHLSPVRDVTAGNDTLTDPNTNRSPIAQPHTHTSPVMAGAMSLSCPYTPGCGSVVYPVTPGHPVCESSHIQQVKSGSPSDRSTQYHSVGGAEITQRPDETTWNR